MVTDCLGGDLSLSGGSIGPGANLRPSAIADWMPAARTGYLTFVTRQRYGAWTAIRIVEQPGTENGYKLVLRREAAVVSVVMLEWRAS